MPTPHNSAAVGDFAKTVLMPGDPLRAKYIAENFPTDAKLVNNVRGVQGYTGYCARARASPSMASGMGMPPASVSTAGSSINQYGVENDHPRRLGWRPVRRDAASRRCGRCRRLHRLRTLAHQFKLNGQPLRP